MIWHVMLEDGVAGGALRHPRCGIDCHLAVKHVEVLAPEAGRLSLGGDVCSIGITLRQRVRVSRCWACTGRATARGCVTVGKGREEGEACIQSEYD